MFDRRKATARPDADPGPMPPDDAPLEEWKAWRACHRGLCDHPEHRWRWQGLP